MNTVNETINEETAEVENIDSLEESNTEVETKTPIKKLSEEEKASLLKLLEDEQNKIVNRVYLLIDGKENVKRFVNICTTILNSFTFKGPEAKLIVKLYDNITTKEHDNRIFVDSLELQALYYMVTNYTSSSYQNAQDVVFVYDIVEKSYTKAAENHAKYQEWEAHINGKIHGVVSADEPSPDLNIEE